MEKHIIQNQLQSIESFQMETSLTRDDFREDLTDLLSPLVESTAAQERPEVEDAFTEALDQLCRLVQTNQHESLYGSAIHQLKQVSFLSFYSCISAGS